VSTAVTPSVQRIEATLRERIARNVKARREALHLTITKAAAQSGLHRRHWVKVEGREVNATMFTLTRLAKALKLDPYDLLLEALPPAPVPPERRVRRRAKKA